MEIEKRILLDAPMIMRGAGKDSRKVRGYAAVFNSWSKYLGYFKEKIDPQAFKKADMSDVVAVLNHDFNILYARTSAKTLKLGVDNKGLWYEFEAPKTSQGDDLLENLRLGNISKSSFQFQVEKDFWTNNKNEGDLRTIERISRVIDVSPVTFAAYNDTEVSKRIWQMRTNNSGILNLNVAEAEIELFKLKYR